MSSRNSRGLSDKTQSAFISSKLTIETLEQGVKYDQSKQYRHQNDASDVVLVSLL